MPSAASSPDTKKVIYSTQLSGQRTAPSGSSVSTAASTTSTAYTSASCPQVGKVTKTIVTKPAVSCASSLVPFQVGGVLSSTTSLVQDWRASSIPQRCYTPRRGRDASSPAEASSSQAFTSTSVRYTQMPATSSATIQGDKASTSPGEATVRRYIECQAVFMHKGRSWKFSLPPESSVNDAISSATQQVLRSVVESDRRLGEKLCIQVLPSITDSSTIGEWAHRNLDQPPLIIIRSEPDDGFASQKPEFDGQNLARLMEEQRCLLVALQKQLNEQTAIIRNQASFISNLQAREQQQSQVMNEAVQRMEADLAGVKGQLLGLEEHFCNSSTSRTSRG